MILILTIFREWKECPARSYQKVPPGPALSFQQRPWEMVSPIKGHDTNLAISYGPFLSYNLTSRIVESCWQLLSPVLPISSLPFASHFEKAHGCCPSPGIAPFLLPWQIGAWPWVGCYHHCPPSSAGLHGTSGFYCWCRKENWQKRAPNIALPVALHTQVSPRSVALTR